MSASVALRDRTAAAHDAVDSGYGGFDLTERGSYGRFLVAHARALPAAEAMLASVAGLPAWRPRAALLAADLAELGQGTPPLLTFAVGTGIATAWGVLYVIEGSRLGGSMLARRVGAGLPVGYLSAGHMPGEWRDLRAAIDAAGEAGGDTWLAGATAGADACFALYRAAAAL